MSISPITTTFHNFTITRYFNLYSDGCASPQTCQIRHTIGCYKQRKLKNKYVITNNINTWEIESCGKLWPRKIGSNFYFVLNEIEIYLIEQNLCVRKNQYQIPPLNDQYILALANLYLARKTSPLSVYYTLFYEQNNSRWYYQLSKHDTNNMSIIFKSSHGNPLPICKKFTYVEITKYNHKNYIHILNRSWYTYEAETGDSVDYFKAPNLISFNSFEYYAIDSSGEVHYFEWQHSIREELPYWSNDCFNIGNACFGKLNKINVSRLEADKIIYIKFILLIWNRLVTKQKIKYYIPINVLLNLILPNVLNDICCKVRDVYNPYAGETICGCWSDERLYNHVGPCLLDEE